MNHYVQLAKSAIEEYVKHRKIIDIPENLPPEFYEKKGGVFVSIHQRKELRGCIGTYLPAHKNLAEEIILNAIAAGSRDNRFFPIKEEELSGLSIEASLLSKPEKISRLDELDPKKYGVIVKCPDGRAGLLLPDLDGIDSVDQQLSIASQKGGINPDIDKNEEIYRFTVEKYEQ
ncbi:MAG: AmmeMemoRadiSam system protein A [Candidatus Moranbacteria bacterium]|nr:AmmeMemoRadiSam system protein A [Candidatus Moranbacteria bacterium]